MNKINRFSRTKFFLQDIFVPFKMVYLGNKISFFKIFFIWDEKDIFLKFHIMRRELYSFKIDLGTGPNGLWSIKIDLF